MARDAASFIVATIVVVVIWIAFLKLVSVHLIRFWWWVIAQGLFGAVPMAPTTPDVITNWVAVIVTSLGVLLALGAALTTAVGESTGTPRGESHDGEDESPAG